MLSSSFLAPYRAARDNFPNLLARSTYLGKYKRLEDASWTDTIARVVLGSVALDPSVTVDEAETLFDIFWRGIALPPGRGLWTGGVPGIPVEARNNCYYATLRAVDDWCWVANMLMCGGGVGVGLHAIDQLPVVVRSSARLHVLCSKSHPNVGEVMPDPFISEPNDCEWHVVEDSRLGWVEALRAGLSAAFEGRSIVFNFSSIRRRGAPIRTFGGTACGPAPLAMLLRQAWAVVRAAQGRKLSSVECLDITNHIGVCIKSGNVRRSALIVLGSPNDRAFRDAKKDWQAVMAHRHSSNNSVIFETKLQLETFNWEALVEDNAEYGEPGILNLWKIRQTDPSAEGVNPCQPAWATVLTPNGVKTMADIDVGSTIWSGQRWTQVVRKVSTGLKQVNAYRTTAGVFYGTENHRVVSNGEKVEAHEADSIDISTGPLLPASTPDPQDVMDGLVIGDGMKHAASNNAIVLCVGEHDTAYFESEVSGLFGSKHSSGPYAWSVVTSITAEELPRTYERRVPVRFFSFDRMRGFLRGLFSANGSVVRSRVTLKSSSLAMVEDVQRMLSSIGIASYYTTNQPKVVTFENGNYECKESYDLSIGTKAGRALFAKHIGFLQPYKNAKLAAVLNKEESPFDNKGLGKRTFDIKEVESVSVEEVFDITVDAPEHTYWTGGLLVSNCGEQPLHDREACNLSELYPALFGSKDPDKVLRALTRYTLRQRLEPMADPRADSVRQKNMRIGIGLGGICDFEWKAKDLLRMHHTVRDEADKYADALGVARPIAVTTVKPSGTISLLNGSSPGIHAPFAPFYLRRTRIGKDEDMAQALIEAGVPHEPCVYDSTGNTLVFSFPMKSASDVTVQNQTVATQLGRQLIVQSAWADNAVSSTISFSESEKGELARLLRKHAESLKSISCLPRQHGYQQPPYEEIDKDTYAKLVDAINHQHPLTSGGELETLECEGGVCPVK